MYQVAICDNEPIFLNSIKQLTSDILRESGIVHKITSFTNPKELLAQLLYTPCPFDILLLDILMDSENGIDIAKSIRKSGNSISIIFITSTKDFSFDGYSVYPIHYLLKPLQKEQLAEALMMDYKKNHVPKTIVFPIKGGNSMVRVDAVNYIESLNRMIIIHTSDRDFSYPGTLISVEVILPSDVFLQCHKSFLVNMGKIRDMSRSSIILANDCTLPVGRAYYQEALDRFIEYMGK